MGTVSFHLHKLTDIILSIFYAVKFMVRGLNADEMAAKFAQGGDSAKEAFYKVVSALGEMEDPLAQNTAGVNLFGTKIGRASCRERV